MVTWEIGDIGKRAPSTVRTVPSDRSRSGMVLFVQAGTGDLNQRMRLQNDIDGEGSKGLTSAARIEAGFQGFYVSRGTL